MAQPPDWLLSRWLARSSSTLDAPDQPPPTARVPTAEPVLPRTDRQRQPSLTLTSGDLLDSDNDLPLDYEDDFLEGGSGGSGCCTSPGGGAASAASSAAASPTMAAPSPDHDALLISSASAPGMPRYWESPAGAGAGACAGAGAPSSSSVAASPAAGLLGQVGSPPLSPVPSIAISDALHTPRAAVPSAASVTPTRESTTPLARSRHHTPASVPHSILRPASASMATPPSSSTSAMASCLASPAVAAASSSAAASPRRSNRATPRRKGPAPSGAAGAAAGAAAAAAAAAAGLAADGSVSDRSTESGAATYAFPYTPSEGYDEFGLPWTADGSNSNSSTSSSTTTTSTTTSTTTTTTSSSLPSSAAPSLSSSSSTTTSTDPPLANAVPTNPAKDFLSSLATDLARSPVVRGSPFLSKLFEAATHHHQQGGGGTEAGGGKGGGAGSSAGAAAGRIAGHASSSDVADWHAALGLPMPGSADASPKPPLEPGHRMGGGGGGGAAADAETTHAVFLPADVRKLQPLIQRGIPSSLRGRVWHALLVRSLGGAGEHAALRAALRDPTYYACLLRRRGRSSHANVRRLIKTDARRTFGGHRDAKRLQSSVGRLLDAYSHRNPAVGYCQSMNFLAATLLLFMSEEAAFWALCVLIERVLPTGLYAAQLQGLTAELRLLSDVLGRTHGSLLVHLERSGIAIDACCSRWLMTAFVTVLPIGAALRVWDALLWDAAAKAQQQQQQQQLDPRRSSPHPPPGRSLTTPPFAPSAVPLAGCVALLSQHSARLLASGDAENLMPLLLALPSELAPSRAEQLVGAILRFVTSDAQASQLSGLREQHKRVVEAEILLREDGGKPAGDLGSVVGDDASAPPEPQRDGGGGGGGGADADAAAHLDAYASGAASSDYYHHRR